MRAKAKLTSMYGEGTPHYLQDQFLPKVLEQSQNREIPLPKWFNIGNYSYLAQASSSVWYEQLLIRKAIIYQKFSGDNLSMKFELSKILSKIRESGMATVDSETSVQILGGLEFLYSKKKGSGLMAAQLLSPADLISRFCVLPEDCKKQLVDILLTGTVHEALRKIETIDTRQFFHILTPINLWQNYVIEIPKFVDRKIATKAVDTQLKVIEKRWPKKRSGPKAQAFNAGRWYQLRSIPYIDLMIYSFEKNGRIPYRVIAEALYPDQPEKSEAHISDTVAQRAIELLTLASLQGLFSQLSRHTD